jgi:hypothetical protein
LDRPPDVPIPDVRPDLRRVDGARIYGGIHFRFDQDAGGDLGRSVATYVYKHNLRRVHGRN